MTLLNRLTNWYTRQCNGVWEHGYGFTIETIDNPGVSLTVELCDTNLQKVPFEERKVEYESKDRWMICRRTADKFEAHGAASRLEDMIETFVEWAEQNENSA